MKFILSTAIEKYFRDGEKEEKENEEKEKKEA